MSRATERRAVRQSNRPRWRRYVQDVFHGLALSGLLAGGVVWTLNHQNPAFTRPSELLKLPGALISADEPTKEAFRVSQVLRSYARDTAHADRIASAVVSEGRKRKIDPALLVGVMLVESELNPTARSFMGARGLMQVMPFHSGKWGCGSSDLYDIESNICHGVSVLAQNIRETPNLRTALLRYNGCVRGRNTPNCHTYSGKVLRAAARTTRDLRLVNTSE